MTKIDWKLLGFYGTAIGSVVLLFNVVTTYGESNLKAPTAIGGSYRIQAQNLPECLKSERLELSIKQSGIYLNGSLLSAKGSDELKTNAEEKFTLFGKWENQKLSLSGAVPHLIACHSNSEQGKGSSQTLVDIQGVIEGESLKGKIKVSSASEVVDFSAQREAVVQEKKKEH
ncbi:hypothetical protein BCD67_03965 [Oscillatoriales cyanobacterium USR001]|nr:hypothetical protein BCD67_03965 [Oscillatoriales cyanobacterium USR001]